jgi:hypothetical protein
MKFIFATSTLILFTLTSAFGQTYSKTIQDSVIINFMQDVLNDKASYQSAFNKKAKKVHIKAFHMKDAYFNNFTETEKLEFEHKFQRLYSELELSQETLEFLKMQYLNMKDTTWQHPIENVNFKKKFKKNYFQYSVPMFSEDFQFALFWRYTYCGTHCAYSQLHWYRYVDGNWKLVKLIDGYIS